MNGDSETLRTLVEYTIKHHFLEHRSENDDGLIQWLTQVGQDTARMISEWMRVGFVHGVMNTDNMSIHGLTIDYGPYGWIEDFNLIGLLLNRRTNRTIQIWPAGADWSMEFRSLVGIRFTTHGRAKTALRKPRSVLY